MILLFASLMFFLNLSQPKKKTPIKLTMLVQLSTEPALVLSKIITERISHVNAILELCNAVPNLVGKIIT